MTENLKQKLRYFHTFLTTRQILVLVIAVSIVWGGVVLYGAQFFMSRNVELSYSGKTCFSNPIALPRTVGKVASTTYDAELIPSLKIAGYPVASSKTCLTTKAPPLQNSTENVALTALGIPFLKKPIQVRSQALPAVIATLKQGDKISAKGSLTFKLNTSDTIFDYRLSGNAKQAPCVKLDSQISCKLAPLSLAQAQAYTLELERTFNGKAVGTVASQQLTSLEPMAITASSVAPASNVYTVPTDLSLTLNKPILALGDVRLEQINGTTRTKLPITTEINGTNVRILFSTPLPRGTAIELTIAELEGTDHSFLSDTYVLPFKMSGGPAVSGISISTYKVARTAGYTITFDVGLTPNQSASSFAAVSINNQDVAVSTKINGRTMTISPAATLPPCTTFKVTIRSGLTSEYGVGGGLAWSYTSRTICQIITTIGTSVQGRAITAYRFGTGASVIVYLGNTHGNEKSSVATLTSWIDALEANPARLPANRTLYIIPNLNPDGYAANGRTNAHNVDLNRNFPSNNWKSAVTMPDKTFNATGGGTSPLSEPESAAVVAFIIAQNPRLVLTYHATAGVVIPNDSGDSASIALAYDKNSNLYFKPNAQTSTIFDYDTTGAFEDWLHDKQNIPALLIELWTMTSNEFIKNEKALWNTVSL